MELTKCFRLLFLPSALLSGLCLAAPTAQSTDTPTNACGRIVNSPDFFFNASLAYECLTSVPFNPAVATRFLEYYKDTVQFQSTLTYLKNPPPSYQQPSVDLLQGLNELENGIRGGLFPNQYEFEAALQTLLYSTHDGHVNLIAGVLAVFNFASPYDIVSLSLDGIQLPKVYLSIDLKDSNLFTEYQPSAITSINGEDVNTYLTKFASKNSVGMVEPHADWNQLMTSAAQDIQGSFTLFGGGATFYPGDTITFKLENGTEITENFIAIYNTQGNTGPLETGGDFYNSFVLGLLPASFDEDLINNNNVNISEIVASQSEEASLPTSTTDSAVATSTSDSTSTPSCTNSWENPAYPECPDVSQPDLGSFGAGFISGYFLNSGSVGVLSIPSFDEEDEAITTFDSTIEEFIARSQSAGLKKLVIDVQSNTGGKSLLAIAAFKHFFPNIDPFVGSRLRAHDAADSMGLAITALFEDLEPGSEDFETLVADEWVSSTRLNADTGALFSEWSEFFGPQEFDGDNFTTVQRYNLSDSDFDESAIDGDGGNFTVFGYGSNPAPVGATPAYKAEDIIILSDGICSSACTLFVEMMHNEAGVKTVVAGGRPNNGPMQTASGSRGAAIYSTDVLDANIDFAQQIYQAVNASDAEIYFLPNRTEALDVLVTFASINLRDQVRKGETIPRQFAYDAADCRIWYTPQTIYNYTALWQYAADSIWGTNSLCVSGSTGFATTGTNKTDFTGPSPLTNPGSTSVANITGHLTNTSSLEYLTHLNDGLEDFTSPSSKSIARPCQSTADCVSVLRDSVCAEINTCLASGKRGVQKQCVLPCPNINGVCPSGSSTSGKCRLDQKICRTPGVCQPLSRSSAVPLGGAGRQTVLGVCLPPIEGACSAEVPGQIRTGPTVRSLKKSRGT